MKARDLNPAIVEMVTHELAVLRAAVEPGSEADKALTTLESFCSVSTRVMAHTNPSKLRDIVMTAEIRWRLDGRREGELSDAREVAR